MENEGKRDQFEKHRRKPIAAIVIALIGIVQSLFYHPRAATNGGASDNLIGPTRRMAWATVIIAIAGILNLIAALLQWGALKHSDKTAREAFTDTQRAFVFVLTPGVDSSIKAPNLGVFVTWTNSGSTPTRNLAVYIDHDTIYDMRDKTRFPDLDRTGKITNTPEQIPVLIGPKATLNSLAVAFSQTQLRVARDHKARLYIWGWARYNDVFEKTPNHLTRFCFEITGVPDNFIDFDPAKNTLPPTVNINLTPCRHGNCADNECKRQELQ